MKSIQAAITRQGQVTIPAEVRRRLGLGKPGKVSFILDEDGIRIEGVRFRLEDVFGSIAPRAGTSDDFDPEIEAAMAAEVERYKLPGGTA